MRRTLFISIDVTSRKKATSDTNQMLRIFLLISLIVSIFAGCSFPLQSSNFSLAGYSGEWFEIGKVQTAGGAFWEKDCVCTELNIAITNAQNGDGIADNDCRDKTITGPWTNITGKLTNMNLLEYLPG